ncbi:S1C family serine protease [Halovivax limisalsi]|uniref:S1C family serine protease n=1 Tax=Halovivax limisalsi TaxID=1453760 RepID=UPI001FFDAEBF|nr:trypsin-like peptidase domain-containing protein [Halovivax limisalsi]
MHRLRSIGFWLVLVATITAIPMAAATVTASGSAASGPTAAAASATPASVGESPTALQTGGGCGYVSLYEETIASIAQIQTAGGLGSGFVYAVENGTTYVVTNEHVVDPSRQRGGPGGPGDGPGVPGSDAGGAGDGSAETGDAPGESENESDDGADGGDDAESETSGTIGVRFDDGDLHPATVVGTSVFADLAVVSVEATPEGTEALPVQTETPQPGQPVAAIGSPYGLQSTITSGIVSGVDRTMPTRAGQLPNAIQTDAPINPGNSGGPLVDCESGDVLGVNRAGGGENIGFAISGAMVERIVPELIETGEWNAPYIGIRPITLSQPIVAANDLEVTEGVYVVDVVEDGPASGVLQGAQDATTIDQRPIPTGGDVIVAVDGQNVSSREELLSYLLMETEPGDTVELTVIRGGEEQTVEVTLDERPEPTMGGS